MNKREFAREIDRTIPETPDVFKRSMRQTLDDIAHSAPKEEQKAMKPIFNKRRALVIALAAVLLIATVAAAASQWRIFDALGFMTGDSPANADKVMQSNLYQTTVNNVEITVKEAGYDGKTLFILYSYRMLDVDTKLGMFADAYKGSAEYGGQGIRDEEMQLLTDHNVGWWIDNLWINGKCMSMPESSGSGDSGSEVAGEIVKTEYWRLDNENVRLSGKAEISLPIGERQPLTDYTLNASPDKLDADGRPLLPEKGVVTFTLDTAGIASQVRYEHPDVSMTNDLVTARVSEVCYSPLMTYITLRLEANADAVAAYKAENGEGLYAEDGKTLVYEYGGAEVFGDWLFTLELVDGGGNRLFAGQGGCNGFSHGQAEFVYPYIDSVPDALYLAPMTLADGAADMAQAIRVK